MDTAAWNALLDNTYGATRGPHSPASFEVALLASDDIGSEISATTEVAEVPTANGYARPTLDNDDWLDADEAVKTSSAGVDFGTPSSAWETARFWALIDGSTVWNICPLTEPLTVTGAGSNVTVQLSIAAGGVFEG